ncbi:MAG: SusC/RagA family TonB-linked outer membrane protein [Candidatus Cyclobacteriaceae bacterium M3_2C_046]
MMSKIRFLKAMIGILFFLLVFQFNVQAQNLALFNQHFSTSPQKATVQNSSSLKKVLSDLEIQFDVVFYYDPAIIQDKKIISNDFKDKDLKKALSDLLAPLQLDYKEIQSGKFVIQNRQSEPQFRIKEIEKKPDQSRSLTASNLNLLVRNKASLVGQVGRFIQNRSISGTVISGEDNQPVPGVNVVEKNTTNGIVTDVNGNYTLSVSPNATLVFSSVGFESQEVAIGNRSTIDVTLQSDVQQLDELVVIGYGSRQEKDVTGAISQISSEEIKKTNSMTPEMAMQGKMTGVFVSNPGGDPAARPEVRIRGVGTIGFNEPLYVVDGVPIAEFGAGSTYSVSQGAGNNLRGPINIFNLINPNDIESISVLKDASAAAIYGVRAANGVVLITTKRGKKGKPQISIDLKRGIQNVPNTYDVLNTQDFTALYQEAYANNIADNTMPEFFDPASPNYLGDSPTYDWQDRLLNQNAITEDYNASVSGGNDFSNYSISGGFAHTESVLKFNDMNRYSLGINSDHQLTPWLRVGETYRLGYSQFFDHRSNDLAGMATVSPWQPIEDVNGFRGYAIITDENGDFLYGPETDDNFYAIDELLLKTEDRDLVRNLGSAYVDVTPLPGLSIKGTFSADYVHQKRIFWDDEFQGVFDNGYNVNRNGNRLRTRHTWNRNFTKELAVNYVKDLGDHHFDLLFNAMDQQFDFEGTQTNGNQLVFKDESLRNVNNAEGVIASEEFGEGWALQGYLGRLSYNFSSKYYVDVTVRRDGTSRFAPEYRWGTFPSFSLAWRVSAEPFMQTLTFINDFKLRGGWGQLGNQETRPFAFLSTVNRNPSYTFGVGSGDFPSAGINYRGAALGDFPTVDLSWETSTTINVGFDALLFNNKLNATFEYYNRTTDGILQTVRVPGTLGVITDPVFNIAAVQNEGLEMALGYNGQLGDFNYNISGNITTVKNEVTELKDNQPIGGDQNRIEVGQPLNFFNGYQMVKIFQTQEEVDAWLDQNDDPGNVSQKAPGDIQFADIYGPPQEEGEFRSEGPDNVVNFHDKTYLGKQIAGYFYGVNLGAQYKNFDISIFFQGVGDIQRYNNRRQAGESMSSRGNNQWVTVLNRWTPDNKSTTMPRAVFDDPSGNNRFSDRWIEDAGFMRLRNMQLGYNLPTALTERLGSLNQLRIYLSSSNLFTLTPYSGIDPENDAIPPPRTFILGANINF